VEGACDRTDVGVGFSAPSTVYDRRKSFRAGEGWGGGLKFSRRGAGISAPLPVTTGRADGGMSLRTYRRGGGVAFSLKPLALRERGWGEGHI